MEQNERIVAIARHKTEEDMLEDLKNCYSERRMRFRHIKYSYLKTGFEHKEILFVERYQTVVIKKVFTF